MQEQCVSPLMPLVKFFMNKALGGNTLAAPSFILFLFSQLSKSLPTVNSQKARIENGEFDFFTATRMTLIIWAAKRWAMLTHKHDHAYCRHLHRFAEGWGGPSQNAEEGLHLQLRAHISIQVMLGICTALFLVVLICPTHTRASVPVLQLTCYLNVTLTH